MVGKLAVLLFLISIQMVDQNFKKEIDSVYNFKPHLLSKIEQEKIFPSLDVLFKKVEADTAKYLPLLRMELQSNDHYPYFYYDCSHLLMILSKSYSNGELPLRPFQNVICGILIARFMFRF